jgi:hypothetical protein
MGLAVFPDTLTDCTKGCAPGKVVVPVGGDGSTEIGTWLQAAPQGCGATPLGDTMQALKTYDAWSAASRHYLLLITDGQPSCNDDIEGMCSGNGAQPMDCSNPTKALDGVLTLFNAGVHTFVVAFVGTGPNVCQFSRLDPYTFDYMAELGGEAQDVPPAATEYYAPNDLPSLNETLEQIMRKIESCP